MYYYISSILLLPLSASSLLIFVIIVKNKNIQKISDLRSSGRLSLSLFHVLCYNTRCDNLTCHRDTLLNSQIRYNRPNVKCPDQPFQQKWSQQWSLFFWFSTWWMFTVRFVILQHCASWTKTCTVWCAFFVIVNYAANPIAYALFKVARCSFF